MRKSIVYLVGIFLGLSLTSDKTNTLVHNPDLQNTICDRFSPPQGYQRISVNSNSFGEYLRNLPLKAEGSLVHYYNGTSKQNNGVYAAVVDLKIGDNNLHQCADAVIRLRAEYLWSHQRYDEIKFNLTNGFTMDYSHWMNGYRLKVKGNKTWWEKTADYSDNYSSFWDYLEVVFTYAGTASLEKELKPISTKNIQIGDVFIIGGFPGHCVIVVDICTDSQNQKAIMLAQSYMPAQETQILYNPKNETVWYMESDYVDDLVTPEYYFSENSLRRFK
ncbi:MAG: DUF4846 domain-containing protein [Saprospiraceae bacterium]|nr:DUF4846 domain-containing protein [Saprospiraceae bacterium]MCB9328487.1 DUF4846 domain-containing protein [Lewinellaceae bacterium]